MNEPLERVYDVCMITTRHPLKDHRVYHKEAVSLAERLGLRVLVLAISDRDTVLEDGLLVVCGISGSQRHVLRSVLRVGRVLLRVKARVFHIHDFEDLVLLPYLKFLKRRPVIYDVHEHYELMIRNVVALPSWSREPLARIVNTYERFFSRLSDHLILVEEPQRKHFEDFAIPARRITVVRNLVSLGGFRVPEGQKRYELVYCGTCYRTRGLYEMVEAVKLAKERGRRFCLLLMLSGKPDEIEGVQARVAELGLDDEVTIRTHVPYGQVPAGLAEARAGIVLFHDAAGHRVAIPTKLIEYGAACLPALVNDVNAFSVDYVRRYDVGVVIHELTPAAILDGLARIDANYAAYALNAREAARLNCWEVEEAKLIRVYQQLLSPTTART